MVNLNVPLPLKGGGIKNTLQSLSNHEHVKCLVKSEVCFIIKIIQTSAWEALA